jgi:hypothetical protein
MNNKLEGKLVEFKYGSCNAQVFVGDEVASIQDINSKIEGKGHATMCIELIEQFARESSLKEIWFPTVLSQRLANHLSKVGYQLKNVGKHPKMDEDVFTYVKTLRGNGN